MTEFFADSYALLAIHKRSARYKRFVDRDLATTALNLVEVAYSLRRAGIEAPRVRELLAPLYPLVVEPDRAIAPLAAEFRVGMARAGVRCSHIDAWGYATARSLEVPFLTGDEAFQKVPHVEFVKE